jgi:hypothetical protein
MIKTKGFVNSHLMKPFVFYLLVSASFILVKLPVIGRFIRVTNTMIHESGHAFMALLTSGSVLSIDLFRDTGGTATTQSKNRVSKALVSLAGYVFSSVSAYAVFYLMKFGYYREIIYGLLGIALLNLLLWVRNPYGVVWLIIFTGLTGSFLYFRLEQVIVITAVFLSGTLLIESVTSAAAVFYLSLTSPAKSGDAKNLKDITFIPALFWGALFFGQALYLAYLAVGLYLPLVLN